MCVLCSVTLPALFMLVLLQGNYKQMHVPVQAIYKPTHQLGSHNNGHSWHYWLGTMYKRTDIDQCQLSDCLQKFPNNQGKQ